MSRRNQDIPIRPRYGLEYENAERSEQAKQKTSTTEAVKQIDISSTSYSEIPFLAQYPGAVPEHALADLTPTIPERTKELLTREESLEDDSTEENSKGSSCDEDRKQNRPNSLHCDSSFPYELETDEGQMRHFVAENLEEKLRSKKEHSGFESHNSTPSTSTAGGVMTRHFLQMHQMPQIDANVLNDIEIEAQYLAASVDNMIENLCNLLHSISSITADNVEMHKNAVNKLTDSMDANIKCMYTIMAKTEEISKSMKPTEQVAQRIRDIKRLVDMLENVM